MQSDTPQYGSYDTADSVPITICRLHQCFSLSHPPFCKLKHSIMIHYWKCGALTLPLKLSTFTSTSIAHTNLLLQRWLIKCSSPCCKNRAASFSMSSEAFSSCWSRASPVKNLKTIKVTQGTCCWLHQCFDSRLRVHFYPTGLSGHASHVSVQDRGNSTRSSGNTYHRSIIPLILLTLQELISKFLRLLPTTHLWEDLSVGWRGRCARPLWRCCRASLLLPWSSSSLPTWRSYSQLSGLRHQASRYFSRALWT